MKVNINIECSPEEARTFFGLPDMTALHEDYAHKMRELMAEKLSGAELDKMMSQWANMDAGMDLGWQKWQKLMWSAAAGAPSKS
jgi:Family of unknown function (DUF6489)